MQVEKDQLRSSLRSAMAAKPFATLVPGGPHPRSIVFARFRSARVLGPQEESGTQKCPLLSN